ncbi:MAG: hypothetical protein ACI8VW_002847 [bacterium]|jgi:hypothetical protein
MNNPVVEENDIDLEVKITLKSRLVDWLHLNDDHPLLPVSFLKFTPYSTLLSLFAVFLLVVIGFGTLSPAFQTNVPLNGLIITIMSIGVGMSIAANLRLWSVGLFLHRLESISLQFRIRDSEIDAIQAGLKKKAVILDCKNFQNLLDNLQNTGSLNVTDRDARMIKSKLGARIGRGRGKVSFLGGLLVMLGLLGTFLGLLSTIDSVGIAMAGMANIDMGSTDGMSGFISDLAAPLQGMGLAFSSSLFGLSGSLLVGTIQYFSSGAQDAFIENFSRWLDEQKPDMNQARKASGRKANSPPVEDAELKAWIVGFIQTSQNSQRELVDVVNAILVSADASWRAIENTENVLDEQGSLVHSVTSLNSGVESMIVHQQRLDSVLTTEFAGSLISSQKAITDHMGNIDNYFGTFTRSHTQVVTSLDGLSQALRDEIPRHVLQTSDRLTKALGRMNDTVARLSRQDVDHVEEPSDQIKRIEKLVVNSEKRSAQRGQRAHNDLQSQFRRESDMLKKTIGDNILTSVNKDIIPFIAKEQRELQKIAKLIDKEYSRRKDDRQDPDRDVA